MAAPLCDECRAIYRELVELVEISRQSKPDPSATPQQLAAWFDQRDVDEDCSLRMRPRLSSLRRRLAEHQKLTRHTTPFTLPPGGLTSQNLESSAKPTDVRSGKVHLFLALESGSREPRLSNDTQ